MSLDSGFLYPTIQMSALKSQTGVRSFTRALALAFNEWILMLMLFANSIFSYAITRFAERFELQSPCLMCSRLDHILEGTKLLKKRKKTHWDMICSKHKSEISSLVYCHAHGKLVDVRGMCETCLFSFATTNKSNAETYRLLVGKLGEDSCFGAKSDGSTDPRYCTCCNQVWIPQTAATPVAKPEMLPKICLAGNMKTGKQSTTPKKSVSFNDLPHVGYTELKFHSDTESEAVFSEDEGFFLKERDHKFQTVHLETPPVITLPYDLATDKLLNLDFALQPLAARNYQEDFQMQEIDLRTDSLFPELLQVNGVPETSSKKVVKEKEIISLDNLFLTSRAMDHSTSVLEEKEELIRLDDVSLTSDFKENHENALLEETETSSAKVLEEEEISSLDDLFLTSRAMEHSVAVPEEKEELISFDDVSSTLGFKENAANALIEESELIPVSGVPETSSEKVLQEEKTISLDNLFLTSRPMEHSAALLEDKQELIRLQDVSLTPESKENSENALMEESELICLNDVTSTSVAAETPEDVLKGIELVSLHDISLTQDFKEVPANALMEATELRCLSDVTSTSSVAVENPEDVLERIESISLCDLSSTPDLKYPANALMEEAELVCLNDVTSTSESSETPEDVLKGVEVTSLHDISLEEVPEAFTTNETSVETSKESHTYQVDITALESEYIVVSPPKSTNSVPENSTENCVSETKEMKETSLLTVSSLSEMAPPAEAAIESESSSFNSMSVAAETNHNSGESWMERGELLNLADAYNIVVGNDGNKESNKGEQIEQWMKKDTSRVSEDLKALLTQISASRGIELFSPREVSPKISVNSSDQETKSLDYDMQLLLQKRMLERNESNLSLEGVAVSEIEGESESDRLKRQVDHDRKMLTGLYKELEEERSASAIATNQAMAMITRLQEEKALFQMEALQNLRMMEEQAEYDMEAIQRLNDLLVEKEKQIQDLEAEIEYFRDQTPQKKNELDENIDSPSKRMSNQIQSCLTGFNEERLYITSCLEKIENTVNGEAHVDDVPTQESVSELHERVEKLKGDLYFLEHVVKSLGQGNEGVQFVKEIASHLQILRSLSMKRKNHTES